MPAFCTECGSPINNTEAFCQACGARTKPPAKQPISNEERGSDPAYEIDQPGNDATVERQAPQCIDQRVADRLPSYVFSTVEKPYEQQVRSHLRECPGCQYTLEALALSKNSEIMADIVPLLTNDQHAVWINRCVEEMSYEDIEAEYGVSENVCRILFAETIERIHEWTAGKREKPRSEIPPTSQALPAEQPTRTAPIPEAARNEATSGIQASSTPTAEKLPTTTQHNRQAGKRKVNSNSSKQKTESRRVSGTKLTLSLIILIALSSQIMTKLQGNKSSDANTEASSTPSTNSRPFSPDSRQKKSANQTELPSSVLSEETSEKDTNSSKLSEPTEDRDIRNAQPDAGGVYGDDVDQPAVPKKESQPNYPRNLRSAFIEGVVEVEYVVTERGKVDEETISITSTTNELFNDVVKEHVRKLRFSPAIHKGTEVKQRVKQKFVFRLNNT